MNMQKTLALVALAAVTSISFARAPSKPIDANRVTSSKTVNYTCQQGKRLSVTYGFNANGIPVHAKVKIGGATRTLKYDLASSDNVGANFIDARGYSLGSDAFERHSVKRAAINTVMNPKHEIQFKGCFPRR